MDDTTTDYTEVRWVLADKHLDFVSKMKSIQNKAQKMGLPIPEFHVTGNSKVFQLPVYLKGDHTPRAFVGAVKVEFEISGSIPRLNGFEFLAKIDHTKNEDGTYSNLVNTAGSKSASVLDGTGNDYHVCAPNCDCCNQPRNRNSTLLVRKLETGTIEQVGSSCVDDYIGKKTLSNVLNAFDMHSFIYNDDYYDEMDREYGMNGGAPDWIPVKKYLAMAMHLTETQGFKKSDEIHSTRDTIDFEMNSPGGNHNSVLSDIALNMFNEEHTTQYDTKVNDLIKHFLSVEPTTNYLKNIQTLLSKEHFSITHRLSSGIMASIPSSYQKVLDRALTEKLAAKSEHLNEPVGELKTRGQLKLHVLSVTEDLTADYPFIKYSFMDDSGRKLQWKASYPGPDTKIATGDTLIMTATIKAHYLGGDTHYTILSRASNIEKVEPDSPAPEFGAKPKKVSVENVTIGFTHENEDGITDGNSYIYIDRAWKEGRSKEEMYLTLPFPLPSNQEILRLVTKQISKYSFLERDPSELHPSDADFFLIMTKKLKVFKALSVKAEESPFDPLYVVEGGDRKLLENLPTALYEKNSITASKLFTNYGDAECAASDITHGRIIGVDVGRQKPMFLSDTYEKDFDPYHFEMMTSKAKDLGYTHYVMVDNKCNTGYILPIKWNNLDELKLAYMGLPAVANQPKKVFNQSRFVCVVGIENKSVLKAMQNEGGSFVTDILMNRYLPDFCKREALDFNGLTPASYLLNETSELMKAKMESSVSMLCFTDGMTPGLLSRAGANVTTIAVLPINSPESTIHRNICNFTHEIKVDINNISDVTQAVLDWTNKNPVMKLESPEQNSPRRSMG